MEIIKRILPIMAIILCVTVGTVSAQKSYTHNGTTTTKAIGKEEIHHNQLLKVSENGNTLKVALSDFEAFGNKGIGISGTIIRDGDNHITEYKDLNVTGIKGVKIHSITGTLSSKKADIILVGKLAGMFNFKIYYKATR